MSSCSRNKFYANSDKINVFLVGFVKDVMGTLNKTIKALIDLLQKKTGADNKEEATEKAIFIMSQNLIVLSKKEIMGNKYTDRI